MKHDFETLREEFRDCFEKHVVTYYNKGERLEHLVWRIPGSSTGYMEFIVGGGTLIVKGDYGDSVFQWYPEKGLDLRWLANTGLDYFAGKCQASESGRDFKSFDTGYLHKDLTDLLDEHSKNFDDYGHESPNELREKFEEARGFDYLGNEFEWNHWLYENGYDVFGDDWYEFVPMGKYLDMRCKLHWVGLKLAVEALEESGEQSSAAG